MIQRIYIEEEIKDHPRTIEITKRFSQAQKITIERYGEVFNRNSQNFRLQKKQPALILAKKFDKFVLKTPESYGIGGNNNFYFSHMLNCIYDCRYCFLQGMYSSAHYVMFVNYEDFSNEIQSKIEESTQDSYFFSGYDSDSLAMDNVTNFCDYFLPFFKARSRGWLEFRTKSVQVSAFERHEPQGSVVIAWSMTPKNVSESLEHKVPPLKTRIAAMKKVAERGWKVGLRFDPLIYHKNWQESYGALIKESFENLPEDTIHSVSLGPLRFPKAVYSKVLKLYPDEELFASCLDQRDSLISYNEEIEQSMLNYCQGEILKYVESTKFFSCVPESMKT